MTTMQVEVITPAELDTGGRRHWQSVQGAHPHLSSPFLSPTFVELMGRVRPGTRIAVVSGGASTAYLPFEKGRHGHARAAGMGLSDTQGLIAPPAMAIDMPELLNATGLKSLAFDHWVAEQQDWLSTGPAAFARDVSKVIDLTAGFGTYLAAQQETSKGLARSTARKERKLEREHGPVRLVVHQPDHGALDRLLCWKSHQYRSTGRCDRFANPDNRRLVHDLLDAQGSDFAAPLSLLMAGDRMVAAHFGLQANRTLAGWFPSYDPDFAAYSPGLILFLRLARELPGVGVRMFDLGKGDEPYKDRLCNLRPGLLAGSVAADRHTHAVMTLRRWPHERVMSTVLGSPSLRATGRSMLTKAGAVREWAFPLVRS
jgi:CelD/BcsL family acetyltransferase involved in cellulose biosynthesis